MANNNNKSNNNMSWWNIIPGIGQVIGSIVNTAQTNKANAQITRETNETNERLTRETNAANAANVAATNAANREMVEMQNKAAAAESQKAYDRSKATNQVNLMMQAGMSRAGAINALNGGGSYTPAPVNVSQDSAAQASAAQYSAGSPMQIADLSGLASVAQALAQRSQQKHDAAMQEKQLQEQKRQFNEQLDFEKKKWSDEAETRAEQLTALQFQNKINNELANYKDENGKKHNLLVEGQAAERLANLAEAKFNAVKFDLINSAVELPANVLKAVILEINDKIEQAQSFIEDIRNGKKTSKEIEEYTSNNEVLPSEYTVDGKHYKIIKRDDGSYEFVEDRN